MSVTPGNRTVLHQDALNWLREGHDLPGSSFVTSLPDISEFRSLNLVDWKEWFVRTAALILSRCPDDGVSIFFQSDIKREGEWIDKGYLCQKAAEQTGHALLWHKVVCRFPPGQGSFGRPAYSHLLCFSRGVRSPVVSALPDVLPSAGEVTWTRGMGVEACLLACRYILSETKSRTVIDPFCGHGTVLAIANELGLDAIGIELAAKRAQQARTLRSTNFRLTTLPL